MPKDYVSIGLGVVSMLLSFVPVIPLQLLGAVAGGCGFVFGRRARRADYRRDLTSTVGMVCSGVGVFLCLLAPVLAIVSNVALLFMR
ncbi:MAG TPA: hypothetical protein IAD14_08675 [Candidatus Coprousia avicola]|nr:hypothetical protein [Candidatus Coprousia avicola]